MSFKGAYKSAKWTLAILVVAILVLAAATGSSSLSTTAAQSSELPTLALSSPITGFSQPVTVTHAGDGSGRLFVVEQGGRIKIVKNGAVLATSFLDISTRISSGGERGLLGLAFPQGFAGKQYFYVFYTNPSGDIVISRFRVGTNPDVANASSEQIVLTVPHPDFGNHNGGQLAFSPLDGYLYIGTGDGGSAGDPRNNAQNFNVLLGKILRIDVETGSPATYIVPPTNPFVGSTGVRPEIWAVGMRNPWRFSFDRQTSDLYIADVGQGRWEEINFQSAGSAGGANYGWRIMEGNECFNPTTCSGAGLTLPVWQYSHAQGDCSVTGGYVYRGTTYPRMQGLFFYGDFCTGRIWALRQAGGVWLNTPMFDASFTISTFGEDEAGNLYVAAHSTGTIYLLTDSTPTPTPTPTPNPTPTPSSPNLQFDAAEYAITEGCASLVVNVTRGGDLTSAVTVDYASTDGTAKQKTDYTLAVGRLVFAAGQASRSFNVLVTQDAYAEGQETATLTLSNPSGTGLGAQTTATIRINDDDTTNGTTNPIDNAETFVCQHYHDFLGREADTNGLNFWVGQIEAGACGSDAGCLDDRRQSVSAAFFLSIEFQTTGYLVHRMEKLSFARLPRYVSFLRDVRRVGDGIIVGEGDWAARLEANRQAFAREWVDRPEFVALFPATMSAAQFVDGLIAHAETTVTTAERNAALAAFGGGGTQGRAQALLSLAESGSVYNQHYNSAFVLIQYFGYLRRNPDDFPNSDLSGYNFWLTKLNEHSLPGEDVRQDEVAFGRVRRAEMVRSFLISGEYRERFRQP